MGFFKDFKEDFSEAVDDILPTGEEEKDPDDVMVNTLDDDGKVDSELSKLDGLLEKAQKKVDVKKDPKSEAPSGTEEAFEEESLADAPDETYVEDYKASTQDGGEGASTLAPVSNETAEITRGMTVTGDLESTGSIQVEGVVQGNVTCAGKLVVCGTIRGNSSSSEFFADSARIDGEVLTSGTAKIGAGSVIIGNITASSAVIAGAVKGDIDVQGPVIVDTSAVVMGNIKSRSVQINNGAVIEGFCSQAYADVDVESVFSEGESGAKNA